MPFKTKEQKAEYDRKRYLERRELKLAYMKEYRAKNPDVKRKWRENNKDKVNAQKRAWREANRDRVNKLRKKYDKSDAAKKLQKIRRERWKKQNPIKARESHLASVYRRKNKIGSGKIRKADLEKLLENMVCGICLGEITGEYHIDHIVPVSQGGPHAIDNLQLSHPLCNWEKGNKLSYIIERR